MYENCPYLDHMTLFSIIMMDIITMNITLIVRKGKSENELYCKFNYGNCVFLVRSADRTKLEIAIATFK